MTMLYDLVEQGHRVHCLLFDYKQRHKQELQLAKYHAKKCGVLFTVLDLPELGGLNEQSWIVPNRNAIFLSVAVNLATKAGADTVTIGCNKDDESYFPDCRKAFLDSINKTFNLAGYNVEVCAPYLEMRKWKIGDMARQFGIKTEDIWTCYNGGEKPCGKCPACEKLNDALNSPVFASL